MTTSLRLLRSELESRGIEITTSAEHDGALSAADESATDAAPAEDDSDLHSEAHYWAAVALDWTMVSAIPSDQRADQRA